MTKTICNSVGYERSIFLGNKFLAALPAAELEQLVPHLEHATLTAGTVIHEAGGLIERALFIVTGLISRMAVMEDGREVEVGLVGNEGVLGAQILLGSSRSTWRTVVQATPTSVHLLAADSLHRAFRELPCFQALTLRQIRAQIAIITQIAACNCIHDTEKRMARRLLMCQDRLNSDVLPLTQESLALMLGVQRTTVTLIAGSLHDAGVISCSRGKIAILDRPGLEQLACECYSVVRAEHLAMVAGL